MDSPKQQALNTLSKLSDESTWQEIFEHIEIKKNAFEKATEPIDWDDFVRRVRVLLNDEFPQADALKFEPNTDGRTVSGFLVSEDFNGMENADRQDKLWDILEQNLSIDEQSKILSVIVLTPDEHSKESVA